jgi:hypothetical protein
MKSTKAIAYVFAIIVIAAIVIVTVSMCNGSKGAHVKPTQTIDSIHRLDHERVMRDKFFQESRVMNERARIHRRDGNEGSAYVHYQLALSFLNKADSVANIIDSLKNAGK